MIEIFNQTNPEEEFQYNRTELWQDLSPVDGQHEKKLLPHSRPYINQLRPLWLYYIKSLPKLGFFSYVMARDGAVGIARFFTKFPSPEGIGTKILIDKSLYRFIPVEWKNNVLFYEYVSDSEGMNFNHVYWGITGHELVTTREEILEGFRRIKEAGKDFTRLTVVPFSSRIKGTESYKQAEAYLFELAGVLHKTCDLQVESKSLYQLQFENLNDSCFIHSNKSKIFFSDSYFDYYMQSRGSMSLFGKQNSKSLFFIRTSMLGGVEISKNFPKDHEIIRAHIDSMMAGSERVLLENEKEEGEVPVFFNEELISFCQWVNKL